MQTEKDKVGTPLRKAGNRPIILRDPVSRLLDLHQSREGRTIIALAGFPGSGKSTVCKSWAAEINHREGPGTLTVLGMDGFHLSREKLMGMENPEEAMARRGAPYTFNPEGLVSKMQELRTSSGCRAVGWPGFEHAKGDPEEDATSVPPESGLIIVEGIYTLMRDGIWAGLEELFDEKWFLDVSLETAMDRVTSRHQQAWGMSPEEARRRADGNDRLNCSRIAPGRESADFFVESPPWQKS